MDRTHVVYRCYDAAGLLLYTGQTSNLAERQWQHMSQSDWWPTVMRVTATRRMTRGAARRYERMAIRAEQPTLNRNHKHDRHGTWARYVGGRCRCELCRDAARMYVAAWRASRKQAV